MDRCFLCRTLVAATMLVGGSAFAQQTAGDPSGQQSRSPAGAAGQPGQPGQAMASEQDKQFIKHCAVGNMAEIKMAEVAESKAQSPEVKKLAQEILQEHQKMDQQCKEVAQKIGVQVPQELPEAMKQQIQSLSQLQGEEFDKYYVSAMKAAHAAAISKFGDEAKIAQSEDVKQFAAQQLPTLEKHGEMVMTCAAAQGLGTENLGQAQPAGATIAPAPGQQQQPDSTFTPNSSSQQPKSDKSR